MAPRTPNMATKWTQEDPERLQDSPERSQDGPQKAQPGFNRPQDASPSKVLAHLCPTWTPKGAPRAPQVGHLGPPKSDRINWDSALSLLKLCRGKSRRWEGSRPEKKAY